jgi:leucyl aminopeptidase (aminopeptidase T)
LLDYVTKVPEKYYGKQPKAMLSMLDDIDAEVFLFGPKDPKILKAAPGERMTKAGDTDKWIMDKVQERKIRTAYLPVGYITEERAKNYGFDLASWRRNFDQALDADMNKVSELGKKLAQKLRNAEKVEVTHDKGTKLTFTIRDRPVFVRDGIIDSDDISEGNYSEYLPSGSVVVAPVETSAEGEVVFDQAQALMGKMVKGLRLVFQNGKLTSYDGKENLEAFADGYRAAKGDKDRIGSFSIGLNPNAKHIGVTGDELEQGAVTIGIGYNMDLGGKNNTAAGYAQTLTKATVTVDGKPLLKAGKIEL